MVKITKFDKDIAQHFVNLNSGAHQIKALIKRRGMDWVVEDGANVVRKMREIDKLSEEEIKAICKFTTTDDFWSKQVKTLSKFRKLNKEGIPFYAVFLDILEARELEKVEHEAKRREQPTSNLNIGKIGNLNKLM